MNTLRALQRMLSVTVRHEQCTILRALQSVSSEAVVTSIGIMHDMLEEQSELSTEFQRRDFYNYSCTWGNL